jgi:hypothetical protein
MNLYYERKKEEAGREEHDVCQEGSTCEAAETADGAVVE